MRNLIAFAALISMLLGCGDQDEVTNIVSPLYPDQLKFGEHKVGLKTLWVNDRSRHAIPYSDWNGKLYPTEENKGRQFQINIWYPATGSSKGELLKLDHYLELSYRQINFATSIENSEFGKSEFRNKLVDLGGTDTLSLQQYESLSAMHVMAQEGLDPIKAKVPLVLFPNGMSPASNSATAEFLASHGIAVATFAAMGRDASTIDASSQGVDTAVDDIAFVLGEVLELPYIDRNKIGLIGNAIESSFCAAYLSKNQRIGAYVSLEGGFISRFEQTLLKELPYYRVEQLNIPMLLIYSPHPNIDPSYISNLEYADRFFAHLPGMREFDYLNFGLWDSLVPGVIGETRGDVRQGYSLAHTIIRDYFSSIFTNDLSFFEARLLKLEDPAVDTTFVWHANPVLPAFAKIKDGYIRNGLPFMDSIYRHQKEFVDLPFTKSFITEFINWVSWKKDPEYRARKWMMEIAVKDYPESAYYSYDLAWYALKAHDSVLTRLQLAETLRKLASDKDERLSEDQKEKIRLDVLNQLKELQ